MKQDKIKILFAIDRMSIGGAPTVVCEQLKELDKNEFDPYLLTLYPSKKANYWSRVREVLSDEKILECHLKNRSLFDLQTWRKVYRFIKKEKFDVVYTHLFLTNVMVRMVALFARVPAIIAMEHSMYHNKKMWQKLVDHLLSHATKGIIVSTKEVASFTAKQEYIQRGKFHVLPNPISVPQKNERVIRDLKNKLHIPDNGFVVMHVGRFSEEKGQYILLEAAEHLSQKIPRIYFLLVGHGPMKQELQHIISEKKLEKYCFLVEEPEKAKELIYAGDIFVLPSLREGQSMITYEALLAGVPVIASSLPTIREIITDGENGLLARVGDVRSFAERIRFLHDNPEIRKQFSQEGRKYMEHYLLRQRTVPFSDIVYKLYAT